MFACERRRRRPDIVTLSKALTGGTLPLAAAIASAQGVRGLLVRRSGAALMHGPTYMANPLACAAANASLDLFEREPRLEQVARMEQASTPGWRRAAGPGVRDVRVMGAIGVVEFERIDDARGAAAALHRRRRVRAPVQQHRLPDAGLHHRAGRTAALTAAVVKVVGAASRS